MKTRVVGHRDHGLGRDEYLMFWRDDATMADHEQLMSLVPPNALGITAISVIELNGDDRPARRGGRLISEGHAYIVA
jgi:hypothetical protein